MDGPEAGVTRRRRILLGAAAALCLALAVVAVLAARDAGAWRDAIRAGDLADLTRTTGKAPTWRADETAPFGIGRRLLGVDDDLAYRRAIARFQLAHTGIPSFDTGLEGTDLRVEAEAALARVIRAEHDRRRASAAENLLGVLAVLDANQADGSTSVDRAVLEFQAAIRLDPANEQAKSNLELLYHLSAPPSSLRGSQRKSGNTHSGASALPAGKGY